MTKRFGARIALSLAGYALAMTEAAAVDLPLAGAYGTDLGCLRAAGQPAGEGETTALGAREMFFNGMICAYTAVDARSTDAAAPAWQVTAVCPQGHESEIAITLRVTERPADKVILLEPVEGEGPEGELPLCPAP